MVSSTAGSVFSSSCSSPLILFFENLMKKTSRFLDVSLKPSNPPSFLRKFLGIGSPNLSGCFLFLVDVREGFGGSVCLCSAADVAAEASS